MRRLLLAVALVAAACHPPATSAEAAAVAQAVAPTGSAAPAGPALRTAGGATLALADVWPAHTKSVLVFYRGFW